MLISSFALSAIKHSLLNDGVIAYPTEAVYGFGCHPLSENALHRILQIKQRDWRKGMILVASHIEQIRPYLSEKGLILTSCFSQEQDYPVTWLLPANKQVSPLLRGQHSKIAVRLSQHLFVQAICDATNSPLVSTSANRAGQKPLTKPHLIRCQFRTVLDQVIAGSVGDFSKPSAIIDAETQAIVRPY